MAKKKEEREVKQWITVRGKHVPIYDGESKEDAVHRVVDDNKKSDTKKTEKKTDDKEKKLAELKKQLEETKGFLAKSRIRKEIEMIESGWQGTKEEWFELKRKEFEKKEAEEREKYKKAQEEKRKAEEEAKRKKEEEKKKQLEHELKTQPKEKVEQYKIVQEYNPMLDDYHVGIRKPSDIMTWEEAVDDEDSFAWGDFSKKDAEKALKSGKITIYSSYPIKQGVFVSTSKIQAEQYAGGEGSKVYSKTISLSQVAWINGDEGQYANIEQWKKKKGK